jgi:4-amino-4-deoxy-L-arabinose transferase-like glycosyltransferase
VRVFGPEEWAIRFPSAIAGLIGAFVLERIIRRGWGQPAGHLAGAFAALLPPLVSASRAATVEPTLAAAGLAGILFGLRAFEEDEPFEGALAGLFFGLGFLLKGYAVGLYLLPLLAALAVRPRLFGLGRTWRSLGLLAAVFVLVGGARLFALALFRPDLFLFQLATLFGASEAAARVAAAPTAFGADPKSLVSTLFYFLPLAGAGVAVLSRPIGDGEIDSGATGGERRLDHGILWGVYFVELVVVVAVAGRLRLSSIPVLPAIAAFAGLGGSALLQPSADPVRRTRETRITVLAGLFILAAAAVLAASPVEPLFGGKARPVDVTAALAAIAGVALLSALLLRGLGARILGGRFAAIFLTGLLVAGGVECVRAIRLALLGHRTGARETAAQISPMLAPEAPAEVSFRGTELEALEFLLFRTGATWEGMTSPEEFRAEVRAGKVRAWIYQEAAPPGPLAPPLSVREALAADLRDVTPQVDARAGRTTGLRVFVPR